MQKHGPNTSDPLGSGRRCGACINTLSVSRRETCLPQAFLHDNDEANRRGGGVPHSAISLGFTISLQSISLETTFTCY